jgi:hypothetical protein
MGMTIEERIAAKKKKIEDERKDLQALIKSAESKKMQDLDLHKKIYGGIILDALASGQLPIELENWIDARLTDKARRLLGKEIAKP